MTASRFTLGDAEIAKVIMTMAEHAARLADPAYAKKLREDVMALPDDKKTQMDAADALIAKGNALKAEIKKQQDDANAQLAERERIVKVREATVEQQKTLKAEAEAAEARAKAVKEENKKKEADLATISARHKDAENIHVRTAATLDKQKADLDTYRASLEAKAKELQMYENEINETAMQMQGLVKSKIRK